MGKQRSRNGWKDRKRFLQNYIVVNGYVCPGSTTFCIPPSSSRSNHIVPLELGGRDLGNRRVLCSRCNRSRGARFGNDLRRAKTLAPVRHPRDW